MTALDYLPARSIAAALVGVALGIIATLYVGGYWTAPHSDATPARVVWQVVEVTLDGNEYVLDTRVSLGDCWQALHELGRERLACERTDIVPR